MGPTVSSISHCCRVKESPSPTMTAWFQWSSPSPLTFLNTATALFLSQTSCPEVGKYPLLGIASVSFPWQWSHADFFSGCLLKCSQFSSFICLTLYYSPPLPWNLVPVQSKRHTEGWPWGPCLLLCNLCPWRSPWTSMLRSAAVNPLSVWHGARTGDYRWGWLSFLLPAYWYIV